MEIGIENGEWRIVKKIEIGKLFPFSNFLTIFYLPTSSPAKVLRSKI